MVDYETKVNSNTGTKNFDRVTGDQGLEHETKNVQDQSDIGTHDMGSMNAPGRESKDFGQQQKPDINKTPLV